MEMRQQFLCDIFYESILSFVVTSSFHIFRILLRQVSWQVNEYVLLLNQRLPTEKAVLQCKAGTSAYILLEGCSHMWP